MSQLQNLIRGLSASLNLENLMCYQGSTGAPHTDHQCSATYFRRERMSANDNSDKFLNPEADELLSKAPAIAMYKLFHYNAHQGSRRMTTPCGCSHVGTALINSLHAICYLVITLTSLGLIKHI